MPHYNQFDSSAMEPQHDIKGVHDGYMVRTPRGPYRIWFGEVGADHGDSSDDAKQRVWDAACQRSDAQDDPERMMDFDDISDESMGALYGGRGWGVTGFRVFTLGGPIDIDLTEEEQVAFHFMDDGDEDKAEGIMRDVKKRAYGALIVESPRVWKMLLPDGRISPTTCPMIWLMLCVRIKKSNATTKH